MAVTNNKKEQEVQQAQQKPAAYTGLQGVSDTTASKLGQLQQGYQPNDQVQAAQAQLQNVQAQKPQTYNSKYSGALDNILNQIQNPQEFKYSFNGDELFKYYADLFTQQGKQAAQDVQGQAAALTGGYGNSYGQMLGQQQYDQYLLNLYDKGMDLQGLAYQRFKDNQANQQNIYNILAAQDAADYGRYRDELGDWQNERAYWTDQENQAYNRDYGQYSDQLANWMNFASAENADYWTGLQQAENIRQFDVQQAENVRQFNEQLQEKIREFDASLDYDKMTNEQKRAAEYAMSILANGQMPSLELLKAAGLSEEDAMKMMAQLKSGGGSGPSRKEYYTDNKGNFFEFKDTKDGVKAVKVDQETVFKNKNAVVNDTLLPKMNNDTTQLMMNGIAAGAGVSTASKTAAAQGMTAAEYAELMKKLNKNGK